MTVKDIANTVRGRRVRLGLSQAELARRAGVSRKWVVEFETGKPTAQLLHVLRVLDVLGLTLVTQDVGDSAPGIDTVDLDALLAGTNAP